MKSYRHKRVLIYGGSATASWAVAHAFAMGTKEILWACRQGLKQIEDEGNPIGRNQETIAAAKKLGLIKSAEIEKITLIQRRSKFDRRLGVTFKSIEGDSSGVSMAFDQIVYAIGANPMDPLGPGGILTLDIQRCIAPVWDRNYRFTSWQNGNGAASLEVITALKDISGDLWVVGAAVFRGLGLKAIQDKLTASNNRYAKVGEILATGGSPPEGIAILDATINAVTGFRMDRSTFNWNKANRRDIFKLLSETYVTGGGIEIPYTIREKMVDDIVVARAATKKGFTNDDVGLFDDDKLTELMFDLKRKYTLKIDPTRLPGVKRPLNKQMMRNIVFG